MTLDTSKKYVFVENIWEYDGGWCAPGEPFCWQRKEFQYFADKGLVTEVKEPRRFELEVELDGAGVATGQNNSRIIGDIIREGATGFPFNRTDVANTRWKIIGEEVL